MGRPPRRHGLDPGARDDRRRQRRLHPHHGGRATRSASSGSCRGSRTAARSTRASTTAPTASPARSSSSPGDLLDGEGEYAGQKVCPIHGRPVETVSETNWFFRLSAYAEKLLAHYEANPLAVEPQSAYNEVTSFLRGGLQDLSISRSTFDWGIPVPWDPSQVVYVWFDALLNYATAVGLGDEPGTPGAEQFAATWPADVHLVGKDILRFHAVIWPAMLMAAELPLPKKVFAHGWLLVGGEKMSKTKLTGIAPSQIIDHFGSDAFRYYFLRSITFGSDGSFSWEDMSARYTSELANGLGNLAVARARRWWGSTATACCPRRRRTPTPRPSCSRCSRPPPWLPTRRSSRWTSSAGSAR